MRSLLLFALVSAAAPVAARAAHTVEGAQGAGRGTERLTLPLRRIRGGPPAWAIPVGVASADKKLPPAETRPRPRR